MTVDSEQLAVGNDKLTEDRIELEGRKYAGSQSRKKLIHFKGFMAGAKFVKEFMENGGQSETD